MSVKLYEYAKRKRVWFDMNVIVITVAKYTHQQRQEDAGKESWSSFSASLNMA